MRSEKNVVIYSYMCDLCRKEITEINPKNDYLNDYPSRMINELGHLIDFRISLATSEAKESGRDMHFHKNCAYQIIAQAITNGEFKNVT